MLHEGKDYGELSTGGTTLAFSSRTLLRRLGKSPEPPVPGRPTFELAFETTDVEDPLSSSMRCWRKTYSGTASRKLGQTTAYVSDLDGFLVEICSPVDATAQ